MDVIGKAAVAAGIQCLESKREEGVWLTHQCEMIRLGRKELKEQQ